MPTMPIPATTASEAPAPFVAATVFGTDHQYIEWRLAPGEALWLEQGAFLGAQGVIQLSARTIGASARSWLGVLAGPLRWLLYAVSKKVSGEALWSEYIVASSHATVLTANPWGGQVQRAYLDGDDDVLMMRRGAWIAHVGEVILTAAFQSSLMPAIMTAAPLWWQAARGVGDVYFGACGRMHTVTLDATTPTVVCDARSVLAWQGKLDWRPVLVRDVRGAVFSGEGVALLEASGTGTVWLDTRDQPHRPRQRVAAVSGPP